MSNRKLKLIPVERDLIEALARILGTGSAAQAVLNEFDRRKSAGEDVAIFEGPRCFLVVPAMESRQ